MSSYPALSSTLSYAAFPNMRFRHIFGEGAALYAVRDDGALLWQQIPSGTPPAGMSVQGCKQIGAGWESFLHVFTGGKTALGTVLYAVDPAGGLHWYCDTNGAGGNSPDGSTGWAQGSGNQIGQGWDQFVHLFSGGGGIIYAIRPTGELLWYKDLWQNGQNAANGSAGWAQGSGNQIGAGWNQFTYVVSGGGGNIYAVEPTGELFWYEDLWQNGANAANGTTGWATNSSKQIGAAWDMFTYVLSCRSGILLGARIEEYGGNLLWFQDTLRDGSNGPDGLAASLGAYIGQGWQIAPIEGFCWPPGASAGGTIQFYVSANLAQPFQLSFVNMAEVSLNANVYGIPIPPPSGAPSPQITASFQTTNGLAWRNGCTNWPESFKIQIPSNWASGVYGARCVDANNCKYDIVFTVQPGSTSQNRLLVLVTPTRGPRITPGVACRTTLSTLTGPTSSAIGGRTCICSTARPTMSGSATSATICCEARSGCSTG